MNTEPIQDETVIDSPENYVWDNSYIYRTEPTSISLIVELLLRDSPELLSIYTRLAFLAKKDLLGRFSQKDLALQLKISPQYLVRITKKLEDLHLVERIKHKKTVRVVLLVPPIPKEMVDELEQLNYSLTLMGTIKLQFNPEKLQEMLDTTSKNLIKAVKKIPKKELTLTYIYNNNLLTTKPVNTKGDHLKIPKKRNENIKRFPKIQYNQVISAYKRISGSDRKGSELKTAMNYTRAMFLAGRTPKQIIDFMEWIEENKDQKKFEWLKFWTMGTVQKWLPDYLSGRLTNEEEQDDGYERF